jgi:outer membrane receptor for ferrienterochelin and colicin
MGGIVNIITRKNRGSRTGSIELRQRYTTNLSSSQWEKPGFSEIEPRDDEYNHWGGILNGPASVSHNNDLFGVGIDAGYYFEAGAVDTIVKRPVSIFDPRPYYYLQREQKKNLRLAINTDKTIIDALAASFAFADESTESSSSDNQKLSLSTRRLDANLTARHDLSSNLSLYAWVSGQQHYDDRTRYNYDSRLIMEREDLTFPTAEAEVTTTIKAGESNTVTVGFNGRFEAAEAVFIQGGRKSAYHMALFAQDVINIGASDRIILTPGIRYTGIADMEQFSLQYRNTFQHCS